MVSGGAVVATASAMSLLMNELTDKRACARFGRLVKGTKTRVFYMTNVCLFSWMASVVALGDVKYTREWIISFVLGLVGLIVCIVSTAHIKIISNHLLASDSM